jgi:hypothetical protein
MHLRGIYEPIKNYKAPAIQIPQKVRKEPVMQLPSIRPFSSKYFSTAGTPPTYSSRDKSSITVDIGLH